MLCHIISPIKRIIFLIIFLIFFFSDYYFFYYVTVSSIIFYIIFDYVRCSHPNLQKLADANSRPMRWAMTVKCPWAPAKLRDQQGSSLYQAKSTYEAEQQLLYALILYYTYYFECLARIEQLVTLTYALQDNMHRIYERYHAITSRRKLSLLAYGPNPCHFLLYYSHYVTIISYYTNYFRNQKCDLGAYSLQKTSQSWAYKPRASRIQSASTNVSSPTVASGATGPLG